MKNINKEIKDTIIPSLYIHIPFCDHICIYCDFYKMIAKEEEQEKYIEYVIKELNLRKLSLLHLETIYIGGGTPSILNVKLLTKLLDTLDSLIDMNKIKEFTIEVNPNDITREFINVIKKYKCNRISLGIQSLNDQKLSFLRRNHNKEIVLKALTLLRDNEFNNINCDLIYGCNNDNISLIKKDIDLLLTFPNVTHLSTYSLIIEDKTILKKMINENKYQKMDEDLDADIYDFICMYLKEKGFNHYEVSNFAKPGYESLHNLTYWNSDYYLGVGVNASYFINNYRITNISNLNKYYKWIDSNLEEQLYNEFIFLTKKDLCYDYIIMGLRKIKGISLQEFKSRFEDDLISMYKTIKTLCDEGCLIVENGYLKVRENKIYLLNNILVKILYE